MIKSTFTKIRKLRKNTWFKYYSSCSFPTPKEIEIVTGWGESFWKDIFISFSNSTASVFSSFPATPLFPSRCFISRLVPLPACNSFPTFFCATRPLIGMIHIFQCILIHCPEIMVFIFIYADTFTMNWRSAARRLCSTSPVNGVNVNLQSATKGFQFWMSFLWVKFADLFCIFH